MNALNIDNYILTRIAPLNHELVFTLVRRGRVVWGERVMIRSPKARFLSSDDLGTTYIDLF